MQTLLILFACVVYCICLFACVLQRLPRAAGGPGGARSRGAADVERAPVVGVLVHGVLRGGLATAGATLLSARGKVPQLHVTQVYSGVVILSSRSKIYIWTLVLLAEFSFGVQRD